MPVLKPGKYYWCSCGKSEKGLFCDGSHKESGKKPVVFEVTEEQDIPLCGCRKTIDLKLCWKLNHTAIFKRPTSR